MSLIFTPGTLPDAPPSYHPPRKYPDLTYRPHLPVSSHQKRPETWHVADYMREFGDLVSFINNHPNIPVKNNLIGPSVASADWTPEMVWDAGYIETFKDALSIIAVEQYALSF